MDLKIKIVQNLAVAKGVMYVRAFPTTSDKEGFIIL